MLAVSPSVTFLKVYIHIFWANKFLLVTISGSRKALLVLLCKLECFAVCWEFNLCLAIIYKLKGGKKG